MPSPREHNRRILIIDDNRAIHDDFAKLLAARPVVIDALVELETALFGDTAPSDDAPAVFELESAFQGRDGLARVVAACAAGRPFAVAFVDMRMPPGWDGLETIAQIWRVDPDVQVVVCSAYSDYSWGDFRARLGASDSLLILKKPFDTIEAIQCAHALSAKWGLAREVRAQVDGLEATVRARTAELEAANARLVAEMRERERMEIELRLSQKLEAIGQLASGVAHEINNPLQYVGDYLTFIRDGVTELLATSTRVETELATSLPEALDAVEQGIARITSIVRAMKEIAHPGPREAWPTDLNRALGNVLQVSATTYRSIADVALELGELPLVTCFAGELNQVFVNLIVNAAQAMEDSRAERPRGTLGVRTRVDGGDVVISISDTGGGIPVAHRARIFDAFFTTKELGRGTGQGLAISRNIVVERHGGRLTFDTELGVGTTFHVRVPIAGPVRRRGLSLPTFGTALGAVQVANAPSTSPVVPACACAKSVE